jgi:hypothetical protein
VLEWVDSLPEGQRRPLPGRLGDMPTQRRSRLFQPWEAMQEGERLPPRPLDAAPAPIAPGPTPGD